MLQLFIILPGTPVDPANVGAENCVQLETLTEGIQSFRKSELVNNLQSVNALCDTGAVNAKIYSFSRRKNPVQLLKAGMAMRSLIGKSRPQLVYVFWGGISAWIVTLFSPVPVVVCLLGSDLMGSYDSAGNKTLFGKMLAFFSRRASVRAKGIVVMSEKMKNFLPATCHGKTLVLPEGVDLQKFYPKSQNECRNTLGWESKQPVVLFFNSGAFVKNYPLAKNALELLKKEMPDVRMELVKNIAHHQLIDYYNAADLLLLTSRHEGSNNSIKEALACNCPVVSTDAGDAAERLDGVHPSFIAKEHDAGVLAQKMKLVLAERKRCNGREMVELVSVQNVARQLKSFLEKVLENTR